MQLKKKSRQKILHKFRIFLNLFLRFSFFIILIFEMFCKTLEMNMHYLCVLSCREIFRLCSSHFHDHLMLIHIQDISQTFLCVFCATVYINNIGRRKRLYDTRIYFATNIDIKNLKKLEEIALVLIY